MTVSSSQRQCIALPGWLALVIFAGSAAALAGGYWDDAWHTERGRDSFLIAPHLAIYGGVASAGWGLALWAALAGRAVGPRAALRHPPLALAALSVTVTLASGPIDNAWHEAFGRDAVIWSPPHLLGIVGTAGLAMAVCLELAGRAEPWARGAAVAAAGMLLAALTFPVVEYETDVPQFDESWYLPVLAGGSVLALALARNALGGRHAAAAAAGAHLVFVAATAAFLLALGFDAPLLPLLVVPAAVLDLAGRRRLGPAVTAAAAVTALYAAYVPWLLLWNGVRLDAADVASGLPVAFAAAWLALAVIDRSAARAVAVPALVAALAVGAGAGAEPAVAHDPGQGDEVGAVNLEVTARDGRITLDARPDDCGLRPVAVVARRAGRTVRAPLRARGCRHRGEVTVDSDGRWFVYGEWRDGAQAVESWLPVKLDGGHGHAAEDGRYAYVPPAGDTPFTEVAAGGMMYAAMLALLGAIIALAGRSRRP